MKQRDKHIKDILFSRMFLFADENADNTKTDSNKPESSSTDFDITVTNPEAVTKDSTVNVNLPTDGAEVITKSLKKNDKTSTNRDSVSVNSPSVKRYNQQAVEIETGNMNGGNIYSPSDPEANIPGPSFSPQYKNYHETKNGVKVATDLLPVLDTRSKPTTEDLLYSKTGEGNVSVSPKVEASNIERTPAPSPAPSQSPASAQQAPTQPASAKSSFLTKEGNVDNEKHKKYGEEVYEPGYKKEVTEAFETWLKGEEGKNATNQQKLDKKNEFIRNFNSKPENADYLAMKKGQNTTWSIAVDMLPREGETWSQAYKRWTPEQKAAAWGGLGIGGLFSVGLMSKKKKDMLDYALMIGSPLAGLAAGAGGAAMYHSDPNTVNQGRYQHYYKQYTTPTKGAQ